MRTSLFLFQLSKKGTVNAALELNGLMDLYTQLLTKRLLLTKEALATLEGKKKRRRRRNVC